MQIDDGIRVDARIEGVDGLKPETIEIGMELQVKFLHRGEGEDLETFLAYEPV